MAKTNHKIACNDYKTALTDLKKMYERELTSIADSEIKERNFDMKNGEGFIKLTSGGTIEFALLDLS